MIDVKKRNAEEQGLKKFEAILTNDNKLKEIGNKVVKESFRRAMLERVGIRDDDVILVLKKGDVVPIGLRNEPGILISKAGRLAYDWCKTWGKTGDWGGNVWAKCRKDVELPWDPGFHARTGIVREPQERLVQLLLKEKFTPEEIELLKKYDMI